MVFANHYIKFYPIELQYHSNTFIHFSRGASMKDCEYIIQLTLFLLLLTLFSFHNIQVDISLDYNDPTMTE